VFFVVWDAICVLVKLNNSEVVGKLTYIYDAYSGLGSDGIRFDSEHGISNTHHYRSFLFRFPREN